VTGRGRAVERERPQDDAGFPDAWSRALAPDARDADAGARIARSWVAARRASSSASTGRARHAWRLPALGAALAVVALVVALPWLQGGPAPIGPDALFQAYGDAMIALPIESP
jgi:hypothetical protein